MAGVFEGQEAVMKPRLMGEEMPKANVDGCPIRHPRPEPGQDVRDRCIEVEKAAFRKLEGGCRYDRFRHRGEPELGARVDGPLRLPVRKAKVGGQSRSTALEDTQLKADDRACVHGASKRILDGAEGRTVWLAYDNRIIVGNELSGLHDDSLRLIHVWKVARPIARDGLHDHRAA